MGVVNLTIKDKDGNTTYDGVFDSKRAEKKPENEGTNKSQLKRHNRKIKEKSKNAKPSEP